MYEIWLMLNIVYEIALPLWPGLLALLVVWLVLLAKARGPALGRQGGPALVLGAAAAALLFVGLPSLTQSSLGNLGYWVDWAFVAAVAVAGGVAVGLLLWPLLALLRGGRAA